MRTQRAALQDVVLIDDADDDGGDDGEDGSGHRPAAGPGGGDPGPFRRFARRWTWPVVGVVILALVLPDVVGARRESARLAGLAGVPGIVAPLDGPVRELWTTSDYPYPSTTDLGGVLVGFSFDLAVATEVLDSTVHGVDAHTGRELWSMELGGQSGGAQCVPAAGPVEGPRQAVLVCVVVDAAAPADSSAPAGTSWSSPTRVHLAVLDPRTGRVLREQPAEPDDRFVALGTDVVRTARADGGTDVTRFDPRTGRTVWRFHRLAKAGELVQSGYAEPHGDGLLVSLGTEALVLSATGELVDEWDVATAGGWSLIQAGGHVLRGAYTPNDEGVALSSGIVLTDLTTDVTFSPRDFSPWQGVDDGSVPGVLFTSGPSVAAWDLATGTRRWEVEGSPEGALVLEGVVYSLRYGVVSALDSASGEALWMIRTGLSGPYGLATDGRSLLVLGSVSGSATSTVRALDPTDGSTQWDAPLTHAVQSLEVSGGHLFAQTDEGLFVALG